MADLIANRGKGRITELVERINANDPANSALIWIPVDVGATTDATIRDFDTFANLTSGGVTERSTGGWNRKTLTDASSIVITYDDTNDRVDIDHPDMTWTGVTAGAVTDLALCYDSDTTGGTDSNLVFLALYDFAITPDGSDVTAQLNSAGFFRAS